MAQAGLTQPPSGKLVAGAAWGAPLAEVAGASVFDAGRASTGVPETAGGAAGPSPGQNSSSGFSAETEADGVGAALTRGRGSLGVRDDTGSGAGNARC